MTHPVEIASGIVLTAAVLLFAATVAPRPKPNPPPPERPPVEVVTEATKTEPATLRARPIKPKTDAERIEHLEKKADEIILEQRALTKKLESLAQEKGDER